MERFIDSGINLILYAQKLVERLDPKESETIQRPEDNLTIELTRHTKSGWVNAQIIERLSAGVEYKYAFLRYRIDRQGNLIPGSASGQTFLQEGTAVINVPWPLERNAATQLLTRLGLATVQPMC